MAKDETTMAIEKAGKKKLAKELDKEIKENVEKAVKEEIVETKPSKKEKAPEEDKESREYVIPLREKCRVVPRYKKTPKAIKVIKQFLVRHMKIYDRDLNKIKIDTYVNEFLWIRGIRRPPTKIKVKVTREGENIKVELAENFPKILAARKRREDKIREASKVVTNKKKAAPKEAPSTENKEKTEEEVKEEKEKQASVVEAGREMEKEAAKQAKHVAGGKTRTPKRPQRKSLEK